MTQVAELIRDALGHLGVIDADAPVPEIDMRDGIRALNQMMQRWAADGFVLDWEDVAEPTETLPLPARAEEAAALYLAMRLRSKYRVELPADMIAAAGATLLSLWHDRITAIDAAGNTVAGLIRRALRMLGPVDPALIVGDPQLHAAIQALNHTMRRIEADGTAVGWSDVNSLAEVAPLPPEAMDAIAAKLAMSLGPEYGVQPSAAVIEMARQGMAALERDVLVASPLTLKARTPRAGRYNIYTDEFC